MPKMLILRGIAGFYDGRSWPRGAMHEGPALEYAKRRGYEGKVLDISGEAYAGSPQSKLALKEYRRDSTITALYGFSGGGYNMYHVIQGMKKDEKDRLQLVIVLGAPKMKAAAVQGSWELVYRIDPPGGHMDGPRALLAELDNK